MATPTISSTIVTTNCNRSCGRPVSRASAMVEVDVALFMRSVRSSCSQWDRRQAQGQRIDIDTGMDFGPRALAVLRGGDQDVFGVRGGQAGSGGGAIQHAQQFALRGAAEVLDRLGLLARLDAAAAGSPDTVVDLAVLGLELRPADHPLCRVEPESPLILARRRDLVDLAEIATFIGLARSREMELQESVAAGEIQPVQRVRSIRDETDRLDANHPIRRRRLYFRSARGEHKGRRIHRKRHADAEPGLRA